MHTIALDTFLNTARGTRGSGMIETPATRFKHYDDCGLKVQLSSKYNCNNFERFRFYLRFRFAGILMSEFAVSLLVELAVLNKATDEGLSGYN